jgi:hypothetical protein
MFNYIYAQKYMTNTIYYTKNEYDYHNYCNEFHQNWSHSLSAVTYEQIWDN